MAAAPLSPRVQQAQQHAYTEAPSGMTDGTSTHQVQGKVQNFSVQRPMQTRGGSC